MNNSLALEEFIDKLVKEKGFGDEEPEVMEQIKNDLLERIENHINASILRVMPIDQQEAFERVLEEGDFEKIKNFCEEHIPALESLVASTMENFAKIYLSD